MPGRPARRQSVRPALMSTRSHERLEELIAADAIGGLDDAERRAMLAEMAEHGPDCAECATLTAEYGEVAARLATALDPMPMSASAEERLLAAARATGFDASTPLSSGFR